MSDAIVVAMISGAISLMGIIVTAIIQSRNFMRDFEKQSAVADLKMEAKLDKMIAVTDAKIDELTRETREHNQFAKRVPVMEEQIRVINHRIDDLERKG